jgi:hypothetical protein
MVKEDQLFEYAYIDEPIVIEEPKEQEDELEKGRGVVVIELF